MLEMGEKRKESQLCSGQRPGQRKEMRLELTLRTAPSLSSQHP